MKYNSIYSPQVAEDSELDTYYLGEPLSHTIARALEEGTGVSAEVTQIYDEPDTDEVDPACDIRTDRFAVAEHAIYQRTAAAVMSDQAQRVATPEPAESTPPDATSEPSDSTK